MKNIYLIFVFSILLVVSMGGCKDSHNPVNPDKRDTTNTPKDPCKGYKPLPKGTITLHEYANNGFFESSRPVTTIEMGGGAIFRVSRKYDKYFWSIGTDSRVFTSDTVYLKFWSGRGEPSIEGIKRVRLIGIDTLAVRCNPNDDGRDTMNFEFTILPHATSPWLGNYSMTSSEFPGQAFQSSIDVYYEFADEYNYAWMLKNFLGCPQDYHRYLGTNFPVFFTQSTTTDLAFHNTYDTFDADSNAGCFRVRGTMNLSPDGTTITGKYWYFDPYTDDKLPLHNKVYTLTGKRIP